ncbi:MAG TPA: cysteine rich repeat-containing protein [Pseudolabrys sp.]|jgi:hypothetical protein|nr:cysteine rich repeat-containing protein [Pseudolabrys sp.]
MRFRAVTAALLVTFSAGTSAALAQSPGIIPMPKAEKGSHAMKGSEDEQNACYHDAAKFCSDAIPDTFKVLACLQEHRKKLTKPCQKVLTDNGQ